MNTNFIESLEKAVPRFPLIENSLPLRNTCIAYLGVAAFPDSYEVVNSLREKALQLLGLPDELEELGITPDSLTFQRIVTVETTMCILSMNEEQLTEFSSVVDEIHSSIADSYSLDPEDEDDEDWDEKEEEEDDNEDE